MSPPEPKDLDLRDEALLVGYHADLLAGRDPDGDGSLAPLQECLRRLDADRRRKQTMPAVLPSDGLGTVGRFQLRGELGSGAHGIVYLAYDPVLNREVALKVPHVKTLLTPDLRRRFQREAQAAAALDHPHIVAVHESGAAGSVCYIASAYCRGPTLAAWLKQQPHLVPAPTAAALVAALADAAQHAHERAILHRDLKPSNILLELQRSDSQAVPHPRITDFGLSKLLEGADESTRSGAILGTPSYMAPEQAEGRSERVGPASDIYALGAILYEVLTDRPPFKGPTILDTLEQVRQLLPIPPSRLHAKLPPDLEVICLKCLAKEPAQRYASAAALAEDLRRFLRGDAIHARPPSWWAYLRLWSRRPERIGDAGALLFVEASLMAAFCAATFGLIVCGLIETTNSARAWAYGLTFLFGCHLPRAWIGWRTMNKNPMAYWLGLAASVIYTTYNIYGGFVSRLDNGIQDQNNSSRTMLDIIIVGFDLIILGAFLVAVPAQLAQKRPKAT